MSLSVVTKNNISQLASMFDTTHKALEDAAPKEFAEHITCKTDLRDAVSKELDAGETAEELRTIFTIDTESIAYFNRVVTNHNKSTGKTGKSGGGGGSKKQKAAKKTATKAAKKSVKKTATIQEQTIAATLAAIDANLKSNFAESKIDGKRKTASVADVAEVKRIVVKSVRAIGNNAEIVTDTLSVAKASKAKTDKPSKSNGAPKVQSQNRIAKALENVK